MVLSLTSMSRIKTRPGPSMQRVRVVVTQEESHLQLVLRVRKHLQRWTLFVLALQRLPLRFFRKREKEENLSRASMGQGGFL